MFDRPGLILYTTCATAGPLAGVALARWIGPGPDTFLAQIAASALTALVISVHIAADYDEYKRVNGDNPKPKVNEPQSTRAIPNLNAVYEFQGQTVRLDHMSRKIKHFCIVLINQRDNGYKIDLREVTWKAHFGGHDNYVNVRDVRLAGAFAKESSRTNSPFVVVDWRAVEDGANGRLKH